MLNDRDDKFEGHEESEYHFSEDEVSYEVETESPKAAPVAGEKNTLINNLTRSKRMIISLGVFIVLVFVVYKMVAPGSTVPATDIAAVTPTQNTVAQQNTNARTSAPVSPAMPQTPAMTVAATPSSPAQAQAPAPAPTNVPVAAQTQPAMPANQPMAMQPGQSSAMQQSAPPAQMPVTPAMQQPQPQAMPQQMQNQQAVANMPAMIPVQSTMPAAIPQGATPQQNIDSKLSAMAADNDKMMGQLQADYTQKLNDFTNQNKAMTDQVQALNSRVATLETELAQLLQALSRNGQGGAALDTNTAAPTPPPPLSSQQPAVNESKASGYNVQAIIPGRAWLRSENGETVTVAEGDTIKELGRVTKIDPYDGIVEINTGNKVISLSYGNGG